ncbi:MAG: DUF362 domain-containing protein [Deltaproteobacteria bacterium]|nr:DUF362 domain-containing protein [Deltaproteobacteria bacterium]
MGVLKGLGFSFDETMSGYLSRDIEDFKSGYEKGKASRSSISFSVHVEIDDMEKFMNTWDHTAALSGTVNFEPLGGELPIDDGWFNLFSLAPDDEGRRMIYAFRFTGSDGKKYFFHGHKEIRDDQGKVDVIEDMTNLFTRIYRGPSEHADIYGAGVLNFALGDAPDLIGSMKVLHADKWWKKAAGFVAFTSFAWGSLRNEYLKEERFLYNTAYQNLVLKGALRNEAGEQTPFFLVSGVHDQGFPWGDSECFWDILLLIGDSNTGFSKYAVTARMLAGLELDVHDGFLRYEGPIFKLGDNGKSSFSDMRRKRGVHDAHALIELSFDSFEFSEISLPFFKERSALSLIPGSLKKDFEEIFPSYSSLGMNITPYSIDNARGKISLTIENKGKAKSFHVVEGAAGEGESSRMKNIKEPTLLYGYICRISSGNEEKRVQIHTNALRDDRQHWAKDRLDKYTGILASRFASLEFSIRNKKMEIVELDGCEVRRRLRAGQRGRDVVSAFSSMDSNLLVPEGEPLIEIRNDNYPTAVFIRRIIGVRDASGRTEPALEEAMDTMRLEAENSDKEVVVACFKGPEKEVLLDRVLDETGFDRIVRDRMDKSGKPLEDFKAVIKANFMFSYNKEDPTSYTDPVLIARLARRLKKLGVEEILLVESHSTYGQYFLNRDVKSVAEYLGYDMTGELYKIVDLTLDAENAEKVYLGPVLKDHPVPPAWRDADMRISFAKNKTHAYAYYTLTIKNVYGALPLANKFKEYHCERNIYDATMEYMAKFPVHFGIIDAIVGADGPFGVFSDMRPNPTMTVIGGSDLVSVDWIGATKMGLDPKLSRFTKLAVEKFGKPTILFKGDPSLYMPWLNVPEALTLFTNDILDKDYFFGNLMYASAAHMDETAFPPRRMSLLIRCLRVMTIPLRKSFFIWTGEKPVWYNRLINWFLYKLGY